MGGDDVCKFFAPNHFQFSVHLFRPQFYLTFWSLSMSDLQVPELAYKRRVQILELEMSKIDEKELVCFI